MTDTQAPSSKSQMPQQIVVLGMHRSGTSALTGALAAMGVVVGDESELTTPLKENPRGFFERKDARRLCDSLLHDCGADWWKISAFDTASMEHSVLANYRQNFAELIDSLDARGNWALKEPRLCLLFPFFRCWLREPLVIVMLRHPVEVARSLRERNNIPIYAGLALWEAYTLSALNNARNEDHCIVQHAEMIKDPARVLSELSGWLSRHGVDSLDVPAGVEWIDPSLHRQKLNSEADNVLLPESQQSLWSRIGAWAEVGELPECSRLSMAVLPEFEADFEERLADKHRIKKLQKELNAIRKRLPEEVTEQNKELKEQVQALKERLRNADRRASVKYYQELLSKTAEARDQARDLERDVEFLQHLQSILGRELGNARRSGVIVDSYTSRQWRPDLEELDWSDAAVISVVVAAGAEGGREAVESALETLRQQSWPLWELVVVQDTDQSEDWRDLVPADEHRVRPAACLDTRKWAAFNAGIRAARGDLVAHWDPETRWHSDYLAAVVQAFQRQPASWLAMVPPEQGAAASTDATCPTTILPSHGAMVHRRETGECFEGFGKGSGAMVLADWLVRHGQSRSLELDPRLCQQTGTPEDLEVTTEWLHQKRDAVGNHGVKLVKEWTPMLSRVQLIAGFDAGRHELLNKMLGLMSQAYEVRLVLWSASEDQTLAEECLKQVGVEGQVLHGIETRAGQLELGKALTSVQSDFLLAIGNRPEAYAHALLGHCHAELPVMLLPPEKLLVANFTEDRFEAPFDQLVVNELSAIARQKGGVRRSLVVIEDSERSSAEFLFYQVVVFERLLSRCRDLGGETHRFAREFQRWRQHHQARPAVSG